MGLCNWGVRGPCAGARAAGLACRQFPHAAKINTSGRPRQVHRGPPADPQARRRAKLEAGGCAAACAGLVRIVRRACAACAGLVCGLCGTYLLSLFSQDCQREKKQIFLLGNSTLAKGALQEAARGYMILFGNSTRKRERHLLR